MALQADRMRENEEVFRLANERLRDQIADAVVADRLVPFLCECADERCMKRVEMSLADYQSVRAHPDTFAVLPGHVAEQGEAVVEDRGSFHVVQKEAA
jgi:hypothetical protein